MPKKLNKILFQTQQTQHQKMHLKVKLLLFCLYISSVRTQICPFQETKGCVCTHKSTALQQFDVKWISPKPPQEKKTIFR